MASSPQLSLFPEDVRAPTLRDVANAVREAGLEGLPSATQRADQARYQEVQVRSALAHTEGMPFKFALNPYRGCTHACEYCFARKYQPYLELGTGDDFSSVIFVKKNVPEALAREVSAKGWQRESVAIGTATDPYQPIEGHYKLTRRCLEVLTRSRTPFSIITKGPMIVRDVDVLSEATRHAGCHIYLSVPSVDEAAWERLEPGTAPPLQRIRAARQLRDAGVDAGVLMMPLVPGITTSRAIVERTVRAIAEAGVPITGSGILHLEERVRQHFFAFLEREYPGLMDGYRELYKKAYAPKGYADRIKLLVKSVTTRGRSGAPSAP